MRIDRSLLKGTPGDIVYTISLLKLFKEMLISLTKKRMETRKFEVSSKEKTALISIRIAGITPYDMIII